MLIVPRPVPTLLIICSVNVITHSSTKTQNLLSKLKLSHNNILNKKLKEVLHLIIQDKIKTLNECYFLFKCHSILNIKI
jgi:predicted solute-binding protein